MERLDEDDAPEPPITEEIDRIGDQADVEQEHVERTVATQQMLHADRPHERRNDQGHQQKR